MKIDTSRRNFLAAGLALPAAGLASTTSSPAPAPPQAAPSQGKITYRVLGKTGMKVSTVGYGAMITSDATVITRAADMGINYYDTSRGYSGGQNERMLASGLGAKRKDVYISSKCEATDRAGCLAQLETSLKELNTDHLDVWLLHRYDTAESINDDLVDALRTAKKQGKARFIGVSTHDVPAVADRIISCNLDVLQTLYSFASPATYNPAIEKLHKAGVGIVAMKVMAKTAPGRQPGAAGERAKAPNFAPAALRWVLRNPLIDTTVPSMTDTDQLEQNFAVMAQQQFTDADQKLLTARLEEITPYYCRSCGECKGQCPKGLPVADMVRFVMYADGYGEFGLGRENFRRMAAEHQEVRCGDCQTCAVQCPHGVHVAQRLMRAQELFT